MSPPIYWIPLLPLLSFGLLITIGRRLGRAAGWVSIGAMAASMGLALRAAWLTMQGHELAASVVWAVFPQAAWTLGLRVVPVAAVMLVMVGTTATLIQLFAYGYMHDDPRFSRFFAYLSLFCAGMLGLVLADHLLLLFICWELMGVCSYLLIGFWFEKPAAVAASQKAFLTTRIGDVSLMAGLWLIYQQLGTLQISALSQVHAGQGAWVTLAPLLIFGGVIGKSAQFPLHVWLPDAMEGPTPVSALIHAATMVAAGVYLLVRTFPLFEASPTALAIVTSIGTITAFGAATVACTMTDIKKVLAYSTISQLGFMIAALGLGALSAGLFHLITHAYFKALLFLGAGSVIHAVHTQEMGQMGGLWRSMRWTGTTMFIGCLAISGVPPFAGFWSKDEILVAAMEAHQPLVLAVLLLTSALTAFYMFRLFFLTFLGSPRGHHHAHESPSVMVIPLVLLAVGAACAGLPGSPWMGYAFQQFLHVRVPEGMDWPLASLALTGATLGIITAALGYLKQVRPAMPPILKGWYVLASQKYYIDELYQRAMITPWMGMTRALAWFDANVIDGAVNGAGRAGLQVSQWKERFDRLVVDRLVNGLASMVQACGAAGRLIQTGIIQQYLFAMVAAVVVFSVLARR